MRITSNKGFEIRAPKQNIIYSLRHSMKDTLQTIHSLSDIIDQIEWWSNQSIDKKHESVYKLKNLLEAMNKILDD